MRTIHDFHFREDHLNVNATYLSFLIIQSPGPECLLRPFLLMNKK
jgi:hypothetical protein